jgi:predicted dehydrogenase
MSRIPAPTPVPETLNWDGWLGGTSWREFTAGDQAYSDFVAERSGRVGGGGGRDREYGFYLPFNWRGFYDFGSGLIGDWGIHILGPANWALQLSPEHLISVECVRKDSLPPFTFPDYVTIKYEFGAREGMPPVTVYWHNVEGEAYTPPGMTVKEARKIEGKGPQVGPPETARRRRRPAATGGQQAVRSGYNCIFVGSKGYLGTSGRGEGVGLLPGSKWAAYELPAPYLTRSPGANTGSNGSAHVRDWIRACKGGAPACSDFSIGGPFTEWLVLGAAAVHFEGKLFWSHEKGEFVNHPEANRWVKPRYRKGWELQL